MSYFDQEKLKPYLEEKLGAKDLSIASVWKNLEGWSFETYSLGLSYTKDGEQVEQDIIIRKAPEVGLMEGNYDVSIEYRILTAFNNTEAAVPKTFWMETDPEVMGQAFYVMEKVEGAIPFPPAASFDPNYRLYKDDSERLSIAEDFVKNLAIIHTCDWKALGMDFLGVPGPGTGAALMEVEYWEDRIERAGFRRKPLIAYVTAWLKDNLVEADHISVVHGDYRSGNYITRDKHIVAILDWELVHIGDPLSDIAYILGAWRSAPPNRWLSHLLPKEEFFPKYEEATGFKIDEGKLEFYRMLFKYKALGLTLGAAGAYKANKQLDLKIGVFSMMQYVAQFDLTNECQRRHAKAKGA